MQSHLEQITPVGEKNPQKCDYGPLYSWTPSYGRTLNDKKVESLKKIKEITSEHVALFKKNLFIDFETSRLLEIASQREIGVWTRFAVLVIPERKNGEPSFIWLLNPHFLLRPQKKIWK